MEMKLGIIAKNGDYPMVHFPGCTYFPSYLRGFGWDEWDQQMEINENSLIVCFSQIKLNLRVASSQPLEGMDVIWSIMNVDDGPYWSLVG